MMQATIVNSENTKQKKKVQQHFQEQIRFKRSSQKYKFKWSWL